MNYPKLGSEYWTVQLLTRWSAELFPNKKCNENITTNSYYAKVFSDINSLIGFLNKS
jgi:hypothetical protein